MSAGHWQITNISTAGNQATASQAAPTSASATGAVLRLTSLQASLAGTAIGTGQLVVRDGATGTGTIILSQQMSITANTASFVTINSIDLRASVGNALTVEFVAGVTNEIESVNAQGDIVPVGYPHGAA